MVVFETIAENILYIIGALLVVLGYVIQHKLSEWGKKREKRNVRNLWIQFLRSNEFINKGILRLDRIKYREGVWYFFSSIIGMFLGFFILFFLFFFLNFYLGDIWLSMAYSSLIIFLPFLLYCFLGIYINKLGKRRDKKLISISEKLAYSNEGIRWFTSSIFLISLAFFVSININLNNIEESNLMTIIIISSLMLAIGLATLIQSIINHKDLLYYLKPLLNQQYLEKFPKVDVTTSTKNFEGKICDIFHENLVVLCSIGEKQATRWDSITSIKLQDAGDHEQLIT